MDQQADLLRRFLAGDAVAIAEARLVAARVVCFRRYSIPREEHEDLVQQTLSEACGAAGTLGFRLRQNFSGFVARIAMNQCVNWIRRQQQARVVRPLQGVSYSDGPAEALEAKEQAELARKILGALPEGCRELIGLSVVEGLTFKQIATLQGRSHDAVRQAWHKCLGKARELHRQLQKSARVTR